MMHPMTMRRAFLLSGSFSAFALAAALISQFGFDLHPCELCLYQRWPYALILLLALLAAAWKPGARLASLLLALFAVLYLADASIAFYHAGVEWGIFEGLDTCSAGTALPTDASLEDVRRQLLEAPLVSCRDVAFTFLGVSMAGWNALYALAAALLTLRIRTTLKGSA